MTFFRWIKYSYIFEYNVDRVFCLIYIYIHIYIYIYKDLVVSTRFKYCFKKRVHGIKNVLNS